MKAGGPLLLLGLAAVVFLASQYGAGASSPATATVTYKGRTITIAQVSDTVWQATWAIPGSPQLNAHGVAEGTTYLQCVTNAQATIDAGG